jgi:ABC-2 type transport system permease protein
LFVRSILARAYPRVIGQTREKLWIFFETFLPFLAKVGYVFVYRAIKAPEDYVGFVVIGGAMTAFWLNVIWMMASQLYWEKSSGNLPLYIIAPNPLMSILLGMAFGGLLATVLRAGAIILLGTLLFNIQYQVTDFLALFAVFTLTMAALYGLGMMLASVFLLFGREAWQIAEALREPVYFVSGFYFPVRALGFPVALAASVLPMTLGLDAMRQLSFGNGPALGFLTLGVEIAILAALTLIFGIGAKVALEVVERKAIQEGTLTDRNR